MLMNFNIELSAHLTVVEGDSETAFLEPPKGIGFEYYNLAPPGLRSRVQVRCDLGQNRVGGLG